MDENLERRLCDLVTGAASAGVIVALALGHWRGLALCAAVVVTVQLVRSSV